MTNHTDAPTAQDPLDDLIQRVLEFNFTITDIVNRMLEFDASGRSHPDAEPIQVLVPRLLREAVVGVRAKRSPSDLRVAGDVLDEMLTAIGDELYVVDPEWLDSIVAQDADEDGG